MAIFFDTSTNTFIGNASSIGWNHTVTGANSLLLIQVAIHSDTGSNLSLTDITANGTSIIGNVLGSDNLYGSGLIQAGWGFYAKGLSGVVAISATFDNTTGGGSGGLHGISTSYTGVNQTTPIGGSSSYSIRGLNLTSQSQSITVQNASSWAFGALDFLTGDGSGNAGSGILTHNIPSTYSWDTNGVIGVTGSQTGGASWTNGSNTIYGLYELLPATGVVSQNRDHAARSDYQQNVNRGFASRTTRWTRDAVDLWNKRRSGIFVPRGFYPLPE